MFVVNRLLGFGGASGGGLVETLWDRTAGTNIGNMTSGGGLAAAVDGNTSQINTACATALGADGFVGKTLGGSAYPISKIVLYGSSDAGFQGLVGASVTLKLFGKNGTAPANTTDGTELATSTITDPENNTAQTLMSSDTVTAYEHVWGTVQAAGQSTFVAEIEIYVMA